MGSLTKFLANRKNPGINLDQLNLFEGKPVPTGLALVVSIDQLDEDPDNPRKDFPPEAIEELAQDIVQRGILQPIVVSDRNDKGRYLIRFGSRRWRAAIQAGLTTVPVIFAVEARGAYDQVAENLKRQNFGKCRRILSPKQVIWVFTQRGALNLQRDLATSRRS